MIAFDTDVLIYAVSQNHPLGEKVRQLLIDPSLDQKRTGSLILYPELLSKPIREGDQVQLDILTAYLGKLTLYSMDKPIASLAAQLAANYKLKAADSVHLATAVHVGADRFITNNRRDFDNQRIIEVTVQYPEDL